MHIKTIKGKKYYYESKRIGKKVTSVYIGPVDRGQTFKADTEPEEFTESDSADEEFYVG